MIQTTLVANTLFTLKEWWDFVRIGTCISIVVIALSVIHSLLCKRLLNLNWREILHIPVGVLLLMAVLGLIVYPLAAGFSWLLVSVLDAVGVFSASEWAYDHRNEIIDWLRIWIPILAALAALAVHIRNLLRRKE